MWLDLAIAMSCGGGGLVCGWIMHAIGGHGNHRLVKNAAASIAGRETEEDVNPKRISEVAERLRSYAVAMAADVDAHQTRVQAVNNTLCDDNSASPEAVLTAVNQLIEANETMQQQLQSAQDQIHEQAVQIESAERRAQTDALTRVPNRGAFDGHLQKRHSMGAGKAGTLALLDVDHFKQFNDVYGHRAGDEVLRVVAKVMQARLQSYGLVARFGGEEFAVILDGYTVDQAKDLVEAARIAIGQRDIQFEDKRLRVACCAGVAELEEGESIEKWLQRADDALYRSKEVGRNCGHWMDGEHPVKIELTEEEALAGPAAEPVAAAPPEPAPVDEPPPVQPAENVEPKKADPGAFAYLPDRGSLGDAFTDMQAKTPDMSMFVMAVRSGSHDKGAMRSLLQVVRATMRSIDRIGCEDDATLLICMPSIDQETAQQRAQQICRSASAIQLGGAESDTAVTIGLAPTSAEEEFEDVVSRVTELAAQAAEEGTEPIRLHGQTVSA